MKKLATAFILCIVVLFLLRVGFEKILNHSFQISVSVLFGRPNIITESINIIFSIFAFSFSITTYLFHTKYSSIPFLKRILIYAPLLCLLTLIITSIICGFAHTINESFKGVYSSTSRFITDLILNHTLDAFLFSVYLIVFQFKYFALTVFLFLFGILELLKIKKQ